MADHPITPPPDELVDQWRNDNLVPENLANYVATQAARWGADQELEACCEWLEDADLDDSQKVSWVNLRDARRPKPPSLKAQALGALSRADRDALTNPLTGEVVALRTILSKEQSNTIRRALEALDD